MVRSRYTIWLLVAAAAVLWGFNYLQDQLSGFIAVSVMNGR